MSDIEDVEDDEPYRVGQFSHEQAKQLFRDSFTPAYLEMIDRKTEGCTEYMFMAFCHGLKAAQDAMTKK